MSKILSVVQQIISQGVLIQVTCKSYGRNRRKVGQQARNLRSEETFFPVPVQIRMGQVPPITAFDESTDLEIAIVCHFLMFNFKEKRAFHRIGFSTSIAYFYLLLSKSPYTFCRNCMDKLLTSSYLHSTVKEFQEQVHNYMLIYAPRDISNNKEAKKCHDPVTAKPKTAQAAGVYCNCDDSYS